MVNKYFCFKYSKLRLLRIMKSLLSFKNTSRKGVLLKLVLPLMVFLVLITFFGQNNLLAQWKRKKQIEENAANINFLEAGIDTMEFQLQELRHNPDALEKVVREKYHQKREDEDTYLIIVEE